MFDDKLYDLNKVTGLNVTLDKEYIMRYKDAYPEHALLLVGVDVDDNNILKWKVKDNNDKIGKNGYFILSKTWFEKYVSSVVVSKNLLDSSVVECLHDESINIF